MCIALQKQTSFPTEVNCALPVLNFDLSQRTSPFTEQAQSNIFEMSLVKVTHQKSTGYIAFV